MTDPVSVLECMRYEGPDYRSLLRHLVQRGIQFRTVQKDRQIRQWTSKYTRATLPIRVSTSSLTNVDYIQYLQRMRSLVMNNERISRAALMTGGFIWRLVIEVAKIDSVLNGPSLERLDQVLVLEKEIGAPEPEKYYDDTLTQEEEDIICGVFGWSDEASSDGEKLWSFWPRRTVWESSSVNAQYWTAYNEQWFLKRKEFLLHSEPEPREDTPVKKNVSLRPLASQREWRVFLRGQRKRGLRVLRNNQSLASTFLTTML